MNETDAQFGLYSLMDNEVDITSIYHNSFQKDQKMYLNDEITKFEDFDEFEIPKESE